MNLARIAVPTNPLMATTKTVLSTTPLPGRTDATVTPMTMVDTNPSTEITRSASAGPAQHSRNEQNCSQRSDGERNVNHEVSSVDLSASIAHRSGAAWPRTR